MKKALFLIIAIIASCFLLANIDTINGIIDATKTGATVPLIIACVVMIFRHLTQAVSYKASFEAVGFSGPGVWSYIVLIFSLVFINTFCLFSGATGVAFIIDDAHRKGADIGKATSGAFLSQIGYFAAVLVISIIGFVTMIITGNVNWLFVAGAALLALTLVGLSALFVVGYFKPHWLERLFAFIERIGSRIAAKFGKHLPHDWGKNTANSFITSANVMGGNLSGTATSVAWASFSALLNMLCLVAIGYAFGFRIVPALIAAFALGAISVVLSPTPQGIGVVEAAIAAVLTAYGCSLATATAIALVYRGIMFWLPFCIGAVLLSQSGFFRGKKNPTQEQRDRDTGWLSGVMVGVIGLVNIIEALFPQILTPYQALASWVEFGNVLVGWSLMAFGIFLLVMMIGLIKRWRTAMALTTSSMILMAGFQLLFSRTIPQAVISIAIVVWLFVRREAFDRPMPWASRKERRRIAEENARISEGKTRGRRAKKKKASVAKASEQTQSEHKESQQIESEQLESNQHASDEAEGEAEGAKDKPISVEDKTEKELESPASAQDSNADTKELPQPNTKLTSGAELQSKPVPLVSEKTGN